MFRPFYGEQQSTLGSWKGEDVFLFLHANLSALTVADPIQDFLLSSPRSTDSVRAGPHTTAAGTEGLMREGGSSHGILGVFTELRLQDLICPPEAPHILAMGAG